MRRIALLAIAVTLLVTSLRAEDYVDPAAAGLPPEAVAVLRWPDVRISLIRLDDNLIDAPGSPYAWSRRAVLAPGKHSVHVRVEHGGSVMHCGMSTRGNLTSGNLELAAGRSYLVRTAKRSTDCSIFIWIEDETSPEIVAGSPPPGDPGRLVASIEARSGRLVDERFAALTAAAEAGDAEAQYRLGLWHLLGDLPLRAADVATAKRWLAAASADDVAEATRVLERVAAVDQAGAGR